MLHRLGVIDASFSRVLHLIRKIRNDFAHEVSGSRLDSSSHANRVRELTQLFQQSPSFIEGCEVSQHRRNLSHTSLEFRVALGILVARLDLILEQCPTIARDSPFAFHKLVLDHE